MKTRNQAILTNYISSQKIIRMKNRINTKKHFWIIILSLSVFSCKPDINSVKITSPDSNFVFNLEVEEGLNYSVNWKGKLLIDKSALGFQLADGQEFPKCLDINKVVKSSSNKTWKPIYGEQASYTDNYNEKLIRFSCSESDAVKFALRVRAYNEGLAFRYEFEQENDLKVASELTEFSFVTNPSVWASSRAQSAIEKQKLSDLSYVAERPLLAEVSDSVFVALGEAGLVDFARMKFEKSNSLPNTLQAALETGHSDSEEKSVKHTVTIPANGYNTPWRYIMSAETPAQILQNNYLLLNLNEENKIANTSFIKPGKVIREVTLTTQGGLACVDFAEKHNLQFVEFDAGWYGNEYDDASDATTITVDPNRSPGPLDLKYVIDYAKSKDIGVILYVNRRALEKQLDEVLSLLKSWGVAGIKYGFVNVGSQDWTDWLHDAVRKAAAHGLMIDIHDEYRPTGYSRTFPNLMTQEGIRGDEESTPNDMVLNTVFTRMIAGAGDQTNCYFAERVLEMGSHASQMAKTICIYSPWQFLYWYDRPQGSPIKKGGAGGAEGAIPEIADLAFYDQLPTVWDKTEVIDGYPGELAVIARKRNNKWYLGAITGTKQHKLSLKLDFLDKGQTYKAMIYCDDTTLNTRTNVSVREIEVDSNSVLEHKINEQNGLAVIFTPFEK